ncbi:MAG: CHAT domain-containing protein [bacterium]|nr:CHAT domain-containing protein [bacterium]
MWTKLNKQKTRIDRNKRFILLFFLLGITIASIYIEMSAIKYRLMSMILFCLLILLSQFSLEAVPDKENYLVKSLKYSKTSMSLRVALKNLFKYYKSKKVTYLARSYLWKLIDSQKKAKDFPGLEYSYHELGKLYGQGKNYASALHYYYEALRWSKFSIKNIRGYIYLDISNLFRLMNRRHLADRYLKKAMDYTRRFQKAALRIRVLNAYSKLYYEEADYSSALKCINLSLKTEAQQKNYVCGIDSRYRKALILSKTGIDPGKIMLSTDDALTYGNSAESNDVESLLKTAVTMGLAKKKYKNLLPVLSMYIQRLIDNGELAEAAIYLDKIDDLYAPYYSHYFFYYYLQAIYNQKMGDSDEAQRFFDKTGSALEQHCSGYCGKLYYAFREQGEEIYSRLIEFYLGRFKLSKEQKFIRLALYYSEIKNSYIHEFAAVKDKKYLHLANEKKKLEKEYYRFNNRFLRLFDGDDEPAPERVHRYERKLEALKRQNEELTELLMEFPIRIKSYTFEKFDLDSIQRKLEPRRVIVKYTLLKDSVYVFHIERKRIGYNKLNISSADLLKLIRRLTAPLDDFAHGSVDYLRVSYDIKLANKLYRILMRDQLRGRNINEVFIIPDRELFKLPFEALVTRISNRKWDSKTIFSEYAAADYLIEKYAASYFLSLFHIQKQKPPVKGKRYTVAAFGDPLIGHAADEEKINSSTGSNHGGPEIFHAIPSSGKEVHDIATIFGDQKSRIFLREGFNRKNFEKFGSRSEILHIATHFVNNTQYPRYSALLFSSHDADEPFNYYHAHEIFNLKLDADLVVLSACESSEKNLLGMQGLRGMTASFRNAGARSMMVSMWPVDERSSKLIPFFYKQYQEGKRDASALRDAKLRLMKKTEPIGNGMKVSYAHPFLWANYIIYRFDY